MAEGVKFSGCVLNNFAINLFQNSGPATESLCVSPASVTLALATVFFGAGGRTKTQIHQALFGSSLDDNGAEPYLENLVTALNNNDKSVVLTIANRLYNDKKCRILEDYRETIEKQLCTSIVSVNFANLTAAAAEINQWVEESTGGKIKEIVSADALEPDTRLVALNAIYFRSEWLRVFPKGATKKETFYTSDSTTSEVDMMTQHDEFLYGENDECQVLVLKYVGGSMAMNIFLPKDKFGLAKLEKSLSSEKLKHLMQRVHPAEVTVKLPKFKVESDVKLKEALQQMNVTDMFTDHADLSRIAGAPNLYVNAATHKTFVEVDEKGTEAAAVTGFEIRPMSAIISQQPLFFIADHPFIFVIENFVSEIILFIGRYAG